MKGVVNEWSVVVVTGEDDAAQCHSQRVCTLVAKCKLEEATCPLSELI